MSSGDTPLGTLYIVKKIPNRNFTCLKSPVPEKKIFHTHGHSLLNNIHLVLLLVLNIPLVLLILLVLNIHLVLLLVLTLTWFYSWFHSPGTTPGSQHSPGSTPGS